MNLVGGLSSYCDAYMCVIRSITRELPDNIPFEAKVSLIESFQRSWKTATMTCFHRVRDSTLKILVEIISKQFERYSNLQSHLRFVLFYSPREIKPQFICCIDALPRNLCRNIILSVSQFSRPSWRWKRHHLH